MTVTSDPLEYVASVGLPKWPQMYVTGKPVEVEQAKEIIRRTDSFFTWMDGGNNHGYNKWVQETLRFPKEEPNAPGPTPDISTFQERWQRREEWQRNWGVISTEYVSNSWLSCAFVGGPHGWCHPDGTIGFVDNVGKWPSTQAIADDWAKLLTAFPFLDVQVTLYNGESCEEQRIAVVSMLVRNEKVVIVAPSEAVHKGYPVAYRRAGVPEDAMALLMSQEYRREQGVPDSWIRDWSVRVS